MRWGRVHQPEQLAAFFLVERGGEGEGGGEVGRIGERKEVLRQTARIASRGPKLTGWAGRWLRQSGTVVHTLAKHRPNIGQAELPIVLLSPRNLISLRFLSVRRTCVQFHSSGHTRSLLLQYFVYKLCMLNVATIDLQGCHDAPYEPPAIGTGIRPGLWYAKSSERNFYHT